MQNLFEATKESKREHPGGFFGEIEKLGGFFFSFRVKLEISRKMCKTVRICVEKQMCTNKYITLKVNQSNLMINDVYITQMLLR